MPPSVLNPDSRPEGASCGKCLFQLVSEPACLFVHIEGTRTTRVDLEQGVCTLYVGGRGFTSEAIPTVPRNVAGYIESPDVPTHCGNCEYYHGVGEGERTGQCEKIEGMVHFYGCCNLWESK